MGGVSWIEIIVMLLFVAASAMTGALALMQRSDEVCRDEARYGLPAGNANLVSAILGGAAGLCVAGLFAYYYLFQPPVRSWITWAGRGSYVLIIGATSAHLAQLAHGLLRVMDEEADLAGRKKSEGRAQRGTLTLRRKKTFKALVSRGHEGSDLRARDDDSVADLMAVFGDRLVMSQRALSRLPFYGYLGTVCGILLTANDLTRLDEATESFKVLRDMAEGLVLAFQTTLVALLTYLPLRKGFDTLMARLGRLEREWIAWREQEIEGDL